MHDVGTTVVNYRASVRREQDYVNDSSLDMLPPNPELKVAEHGVAMRATLTCRSVTGSLRIGAGTVATLCARQRH
jgi:hypothetical protein